MAKEIILMTNVADLGSEGSVVTASDGYVRNYLFPKKLAAPVTDATRRKLVKIREAREEACKVELEIARKIADKLEKANCTIAVKTVEDDKLYGSVTATDIAKVINEQGLKIDKQIILLKDPIKELGVFDVKVNLHPEVDASVKVWVVEE